MSDVAPHTPALLEDLGGFLGRMDQALGSLELPSLQDELGWDLLRAPDHRSLVGALEDTAREDQLHALFARFEEQSFGELLELRRAVIHNDPNDENLLLDESGDHVTGIIDFGDLMNTALIAELAVAAAYACLGKPDPVAAVLPILRGYHAEYPLEEREVRMLGELLQIRLAVSLANCAHWSRQHPENEYLSVSSARAWDVLDLLADVDLGSLGDTFERARGEVTPRVRP
jgi:Ser/Thr protein kinase RdoA (MazF antagonist)